MAREPNVVRAAWAVTTAGASWTWADIGHAEDDQYMSTQVCCVAFRALFYEDGHDNC